MCLASIHRAAGASHSAVEAQFSFKWHQQVEAIMTLCWLSLLILNRSFNGQGFSPSWYPWIIYEKVNDLYQNILGQCSLQATQ